MQSISSNFYSYYLLKDSLLYFRFRVNYIVNDGQDITNFFLFSKLAEYFFLMFQLIIWCMTKISLTHLLFNLKCLRKWTKQEFFNFNLKPINLPSTNTRYIFATFSTTFHLNHPSTWLALLRLFTQHVYQL